MRRFRRSILLSAAILAAGCLAAGCGGTVSSRSASSATATTSSSTTSPSPAATSPTATTAPSPSVTVTTTTATASPPVTTQPTSSQAPGGNSGTSLLWLWILLGALAVAGLIAGIVRSAGRRSAAAAGWRSKVIDAYAKGSALYDAMSVAETPGALAADDAAARWYDIQRRADDLAQTLYALRESAPDEDTRARVADALASLQAVRSAMDAERAPGGAGAQYADVVRSRLQSFEASLRALRASDEPPPQ
jgi:lipoprotein-anchoring transpeptidase ErfK/SrfK